MDTSNGGSRDLRSLRMLRNFRLRTLKGTPKGSSDLRSHPVAMLLRKKRGKNPGMHKTYFRSWPLPDRASSSHVTNVTSGQKALLGRIWRNFRLRMRRIYFRTWHVTDVTSGHVTDVTSGHITIGHVTSGSTSQHLRKCDLSCPHILLMSLPDEKPVSSGKLYKTISCAIVTITMPINHIQILKLSFMPII